RAGGGLRGRQGGERLVGLGVPALRQLPAPGRVAAVTAGEGGAQRGEHLGAADGTVVVPVPGGGRGAAGPAGVLVELEAGGGRVAEDHRAEAPVPQRQGLGPAGGGVVQQHLHREESSRVVSRASGASCMTKWAAPGTRTERIPAVSKRSCRV